MEDVHTQLLALPGDRDAAFFGVYDGHGGMMNMAFIITLDLIFITVLFNCFHN